VSESQDDYVPGDINTIDDAEFDDQDVNDQDANDQDANDQDANETGSDKAAMSTAVLEFIARSLAEDPDAVMVEVSERQGKVVLSLSVGAGDMGRVIGRRGRTAQAIRALVAAAGARDHVTTSVDIID
jgi:uncharacterized protein